MGFFAYLNRSIWNSFLVDSFTRAEIELFEKTISAVQKLGAVIYNKDRDSVRVEQ